MLHFAKKQVTNRFGKVAGGGYLFSMKMLFSEYQTDYASYTFSYAVYCQQEASHEVPEIYDRGFLPYTGDLSLAENYFYLARSLRIDLARFTSVSENRRIDRKVQPLGIAVTVVDRADFDATDDSFVRFCHAYAEERFAGGAMSPERLAYVLDRRLITHVFRFATPEKTYGYVLAVVGEGMLHYWFSFYDTEYLRSHSLGKWMMWKVIDWAQQRGLSHAYIGTCYREKSLYKVRDHKGAEFFDGRGWNTDIAFLKELCQRDEERKATDLLKSDQRGRWLGNHTETR